MIIERATKADARAIAIVHVLAWHETYRGLMPDAVLASLDPREREAMWHRVIGGQDGVFVLRDGPRIAGFAAAGPNRDANLPQAGMIGSIYLLSQAQRRGHGRRLMGTLARHLLATGLTDVVLWVAADNHGARYFYESLGGTAVSELIEEHQGWRLPCIAYAWTDLVELSRHAP